MITYLKGKIANIDPTHVVIDVNGVGYEVKISLITYSALKDQTEVKIHTHLNIKEDSHTLFGFFERSEKNRFLDLVSISGVGPSTALMILSSLSPDELQSAIASENTGMIQSVKGVGAKTAQRIILELKDKMRKEGMLEKSIEIGSSVSNRLRDEALSALTTLGIAKPVAEKTIFALLKENANLTLEELIKLALKRA